MNNKRYIVFLASLMVTYMTLGQNILNRPYSRYGLGIAENQNYMWLRQMGNLSSSWADNMHVNALNPASLAHLTTTAFEVGGHAENVSLSDPNTRSNQWSGNLDYLGIAFPLYNPINDAYEGYHRKWKMGMGFNLSRKTSVGYDITSIDSTEQIGRFSRNYNGRGGTYEFNWSYGLEYKDFSLGASLGYLFGNLEYQRSIVFLDKDIPLNNLFEDSYFVRGFTYNIGALYTLKVNQPENLDKLKKVTFGLRYSGGTGLTTIGDQNALVIQNFPPRILRDTISSDLDLRGDGFYPGTLGLGANYQFGSKFGIGLEFNTTPWSQYFHELKGDVKNELTDAYFVSLGGFYRPNYKSYNNFIERVSYRYGVYYHKDGRVANGQEVDALGVTFGFGMPFVYQRKISNISLGLDMGRRGQNTLIEETYFNINLGVTFNDNEWFIKRKYN